MVDKDDFVSQVEEVNCVSSQDSGLTLAHTSDDFFEYSLTNLGIKSRDWVIKEHNVSVLVHSSGECNTGLLATRKIDALLSELSVNTSLQVLQIVSELASFDSSIESLFVVRSSKENGFFDGLVLNPGLLLRERHATADLDWVISELEFRVFLGNVLKLLLGVGLALMLVVQILWHVEHVTS